MKFVLILSGVGLCTLDCSLGLGSTYCQTAALLEPMDQRKVIRTDSKLAQP